MLQDGKLDERDVQVLLETGSETSIARASLVDPTTCNSTKWSRYNGDVIANPSAQVDVEINGWEREITVVLIPEVLVDVVLAWSDCCPTTELSLVTTRAQKRRLQEMEQGEAEA